jgi:hypothetical protein
VAISAFLSAEPAAAGAILVAFEFSRLRQGVMSAESKALAVCPEIGCRQSLPRNKIHYFYFQSVIGWALSLLAIAGFSGLVKSA